MQFNTTQNLGSKYQNPILQVSMILISYIIYGSMITRCLLLDMWMRRVIFYFYFLRTSSAGAGGGGRGRYQTFFFFPCSADHERDWPPCKKVVFWVGNNMILLTQGYYQWGNHVVCVCVFFPFILDIKFVGRTSRGHTGFLIHLLSAVHALLFLARRIQPFLSLVDREVEYCVLTI